MLIETRLAEAFDIDPAANAVEAQEVWSSWGEVGGLTRRIVAILDQAQVPVGARIGVLLRNRTAELCGLLACTISQRCAVAFNPLLPEDRLEQDILNQEPALLIGAADILSGEGVRLAANALGVARLELPVDLSAGPVWLDDPGGAAYAGAATRPDVIIEMLTSGTTGAPKRIALNRRNFDASFIQGLAYERQKSPWPALKRGVRIVSAPLTHISGIFAALTTLADGRQLALLEKFNVEKWVGAVERHGAKVGNIPPAALRMILDADVPKERLASLVALRSGTAPLDPAIIDLFNERYGLPVLGQYGATEFSGGVAGWSVDVFKAWYGRKRGSVGMMQAKVEGRVVDPDTGEVLAAGQPGLLELRGPQVGDGQSWVRTTDRASLDSDGFLWILGRADNAINRGGFKIMPDDVARAIEEYPLVKEAVVVGIPDARLGEVPVAAVTLHPASDELKVEALKAFLVDKLLPYQIPTIVKVVADFPRTHSLKPSTPDIRRLFYV